ncbi:hypothetical protein OK016_00115 [Vibrio chagasii]|nr:hypothetical protein [Vibrio chagasii]
MRQSLRRREHHLHGDTDDPADGAVTVTLSNGATITIADGATSGTTTVPASDDGRRRRHGFRDYHRCNGRQLRGACGKTQQQQRRPSMMTQT